MKLVKMNVFFSLFLLFFQGHTYAASKANQPLFKFDGKLYYEKDLQDRMKQDVYEAKHKHYHNWVHVMDNIIFDKYIEEQANKKKISSDKFREQLFKSSNIGENQAKKWYEQNKFRIGSRKFEEIKDEIINHLKRENEHKQRLKLVEKIKKDNKVVIFEEEPVSPVFKINYQGYPSKGNGKAKVTIVEFADYQCPHCKMASKTLKSVVKEFSDRVKFIYIDFPINRSGISTVIAEGAFCASKQSQDAYWKYHYMAFENQNSLKKDSAQLFAKNLRLDMKKFNSCMASNGPKAMLAKSLKEAQRLGVRGTPTIYINGRRTHGHTEEQLKNQIKKLL